MIETEDGHERSIVVWDAPTAVAPGAVFAIKAGIKCQSACSPRGWQLEVYDHDAVRVAVATVGPTPLAGTESLYYAEIELEAPTVEGLHAWSVACPATLPAGDDESQPETEHACVRVGFNVRAAPPSDHRLTVIAVDRASRQPVDGAKVVVHPYRGRTDASGAVALDLPAGRFRLFVTGHGFFPFRFDGELTDDMTVRAELERDLGPSDAELWS